MIASKTYRGDGSAAILRATYIRDLMEGLLATGTVPATNWDRHTKTELSLTAITFTFLSENNIVFYIDITDLYGTAENVEFRNFIPTVDVLLLEDDGGTRLLEQGGQRLLEQGA